MLYQATSLFQKYSGQFLINLGGGGGGEQGSHFPLAINRSEPPLPNQCQIITFLTLKTDHMAKFRIELLKSITFRNTFK